MRYYPINLDITGKKCVVLGGGRVAERKVESLLRCGGLVTVISPDLTEKLKTFLSQGRIQYLCKKYQEGDLLGVFLVFGATNDSAVHERVFQEAEKKGTLVNIADKPEKCAFTVPSIVERGDMVITISTSGRSPALARRLKDELEATYGEEYSIFLGILGAARKKLLKTGEDSDKNSQMFYRLVDSKLLDFIKGKKRKEVDGILRDVLGEGYSLEELHIIF